MARFPELNANLKKTTPPGLLRLRPQKAASDKKPTPWQILAVRAGLLGVAAVVGIVLSYPLPLMFFGNQPLEALPAVLLLFLLAAAWTFVGKQVEKVIPVRP